MILDKLALFSKDNSVHPFNFQPRFLFLATLLSLAFVHAFYERCLCPILGRLGCIKGLWSISFCSPPLCHVQKRDKDGG